VEIQDTTDLDAKAVTLSRNVIELGQADLQRGELELTLRLDHYDKSRQITVRALLDLDGDLRPGHGDFISTQAYSVEVNDWHPVIKLRRIT
jgi:hypothetical protein